MSDAADALAQYGAVYVVRSRSAGGDKRVHLTGDTDACPRLSQDAEPRGLTHAGQLPLRVQVCRYCDPDVDIRCSAALPDVPAIEDHDDSKPWEASADD